MTEQSKKRLSALTISAVLILLALVAMHFVTQANAADSTTQDSSADSTDSDSDAKSEEKDADEEKKDKKAPIPVQVAEVERGRIASYISATANLVTENEVKVLAEWEGRVQQLHVDEGDRVQKGQVLASLVPTDGEIAVDKARIKASTADMKYKRAQRLVEQELLSSEDFEKLALEKEIAHHELAEAEWQLEKTRIRAPFSGHVTVRTVQPGQHVRSGDELFTVADFDPLIARIYLPEKDVLTLEEGREARLTLKADSNIAVRGKIRQISPVVDTATGTVKVTIEAVSPPRNLRPGAFVEASIVREAHDGAVLLPREAVVRELQRSYVFVAKDGKAEKRAVTLGLEESEQVEATDGVRIDEQVIVAGQGGLKDGAAIKLIADDTADAANTTSQTAP